MDKPAERAERATRRRSNRRPASRDQAESSPRPSDVAAERDDETFSVTLSAVDAPPSADLILDVLAKAGAVFFRWDLARGLTFLSANARELLGYSPEELLGDPALAARLVDPEFLPELEGISSGLYEIQTQAVRVEIPFLMRSGERVRLEARIVAETDEGGRITGFVGIALNASDDRGAPRAADSPGMRVRPSP